jgi:hypothetical protein
MTLPTQYYLCPIASFLQVLTDAGVVLTNALLWTYAAGTSTPTPTWTDITGGTPNSNPIQLGSNGRLNNVGVWQQGGVPIKCVFSTNAGTVLSPVFGVQIGPTLDQISGVNDPAGLLTTLGTATSGYGADLIANGMRSYDVFSSVRAAPAPTLSAGQTLVIDCEGASSASDNLGGLFYWNASSTSSDDNSTVLKPNSLSTAVAGRWLRQKQSGFQGTAVGTLGGVSGTNTTVLQYYVIGNVAAVRIPQLLGTSTTTTLTLSVALANNNYLNPSQAQYFNVPALLDNGTGLYSQVGNVAPAGTSGVITYQFYKNGTATSFTASGTKGISDNNAGQYSVYINYLLD